MSGSGQKNWQVQAEHSGSLIRLQNLVQRAAGFRLLILQQNRPSYRDGLIEFLGQEHSQVLNLKELGGFEAFEAELEKGEQGRILHLINLESLGEEKQRAFFKGLNYHREHIARTCSGILAFWLPEPLVREMALQAADFWAWREQVLDFTVPVEPVERMPVDWVKSRNMEAQGKLERIKEIEKFLAHAAEQPSLSTADLKRELGNLYQLIGEYSKAEQIFNETIAEYRELDEVKACAHAREDLAQLLSDQGKYDQALIIFKQQVLPVYECLGYAREKAVTMGNIADILQNKGQIDSALEIRKKEELPVYETLGDIRSKAITMGYVADILKDMGQTDKALEIYQEEMIPVFEKLGDIATKNMVFGKIADILHERGQINKALEIYQKEMIPVFEKLGDIRTKAISFGKIAGILQESGQLNQALEIREKKVMPVYKHLKDTHSLLFERYNLALLLHEIDAEANKEEIEELLHLALADAKRLKLPNETEWIEEIMKKLGIAAKKDGAE